MSQKSLQGGWLFCSDCQVDSIWIVIRSERPAVFHLFRSNFTSDPRGGSIPALSSPVNHHICDRLSYLRWMECLQAGSTTRRHRRRKEAPEEALLGATETGWAPWVWRGKGEGDFTAFFACLTRYSNTERLPAHMQKDESQTSGLILSKRSSEAPQVPSKRFLQHAGWKLTFQCPKN